MYYLVLGTSQYHVVCQTIYFCSYSLPIHVCWNLTVSTPPTNTTPSDTPSSRLHPLLASGYQYRCNYTTNCVTFNSTHMFKFNCTFNYTGKYQIQASFYNSASSGNILYNFSVTEREHFSVCIIYYDELFVH